MWRFRQTLGISENNSRFFHIFLATGRLFAENLASKLRAVKGIARRVHPGGGCFFRPVLSCGLGLCPVSGSARPRRRADGGPVWITTGGHYRRRLQARPGSIGPASSRGFLALSRYCYTGFLARLDLCGASGGLLWAVVGWVGIACGPSCGPVPSLQTAKNRPPVGLELGFVRPSLLPSVWGFYYIACLRTLSSG